MSFLIHFLKCYSQSIAFLLSTGNLSGNSILCVLCYRRQAKHYSEVSVLNIKILRASWIDFYFRDSLLLSNLVSVQVKGLSYCKKAVVLMLLQEENRWPSHPQEIHDGV